MKVYFSDTQLRAAKSLVSDGLWPINTFMYVLLPYKDVASKNEEDSIENEGARVVTTSKSQMKNEGIKVVTTLYSYILDAHVQLTL